MAAGSPDIAHRFQAANAHSIGAVGGLQDALDELHAAPMVSFTFDDGWDCQRLNAVPVLDAAGVKGSFAIISDWMGTKRNAAGAVDGAGEDIMTAAQAKALADAGHEICNHTKTHAAFSTLTEQTAVLAEIDACHAALMAAGITPSRVFVLPFGDPQRTDVAMGAIAQRFRAFRNVISTGVHTQTAPSLGGIFEIRSNSQNSLDVLADIKKSVDICKEYGTWLVFTFHHVSDTLHPAATTIWWDTDDFAALVAYVQAQGIRTVTLEEGVRLRNRACENLVIGGNLSVDAATKGPGQSAGLGLWTKTIPTGCTDTYDTTETYTPYAGAAPMPSRRIEFTQYGTYALTQEIPVEPWTDYVLTMGVKLASLAGGNGVTIGFHNMGLRAWTNGTAAWGPLSYTVNSGPNRRLLMKANIDAASGTAYITDFRCSKAYIGRNEAHNIAAWMTRAKFLPAQPQALYAQGEVWHNSADNKLTLRNTSVNEAIVSVRKLTGKTVNSAQTTIAHGLGYTPTLIIPLMTSAGSVYRSAASDGTNIYLTADADSRTCDLYVG